MKILNKKILYFSLAGVLIAGFIFLIFRDLGRVPLTSWDEAIYAQVAKQSTNPLVFHWLGRIDNGLWFEKPPLLLWLVKISYSLLGVSEFSSRLVPALFSVLTVILSFLFAHLIYKSKTVAIITAASFYIFYQYLLYSNMLQLDITVGFFILLSLFCFLKAKENPSYYLGFGAALALGVMTKSVIGFFPVLIILAASVVCWNFYYLRERAFYYSILTFGLIVLPWHAIETLMFGRKFWDQYLLYHVFSRFSSEIENNGGSIYYYLDLFRQNFLGILLIPSIIYYLYKFYKKDFLSTLVFFAFLFPLVLFSISKTKSYAYILIIYPFIALMIASSLEWLFDKVKNPIFRNSSLGILIIVFIFSGFTYSNYLKVKLDTEDRRDAKAIGKFLKNNVRTEKVFYVQLKTEEVVLNTLPTLIFYSELPISSETSPPTFSPDLLILNTVTHSVYHIDQRIYVVATKPGI